MAKLPKMITNAMGALPGVRRDPAAQLDAELKRLEERHGRLQQRLDGHLDAYEVAATAQRRLLVETDNPDQGALDQLYTEMRVISEQRGAVETAMAEVVALIEDGKRKLTAIRDSEARARVAAECEARAERIEAAAERLATVALSMRGARIDFENAIGEGAIGEPGLHAIWMGRDVVRAALMLAAPGALRPYHAGGAGARIAVAEEVPPPNALALTRTRLTDPLRSYADGVRAGHVGATAPVTPAVAPAPVSIAMPMMSVVFRQLTFYVEESGRDVLLDVGTGLVPEPVGLAAVDQGYAFRAGTAEAAAVLREIQLVANRPPTGLKHEPGTVVAGGPHLRIDVDLPAWRAEQRAQVAAQSQGEAA